MNPWPTRRIWPTRISPKIHFTRMQGMRQDLYGLKNRGLWGFEDNGSGERNWNLSFLPLFQPAITVRSDGLWSTGSAVYVTLPKANSSPMKIGHPKRKVVFQPSIFRGEMLVSGRVRPSSHMTLETTWNNSYLKPWQFHILPLPNNIIETEIQWMSNTIKVRGGAGGAYPPLSPLSKKYLVHMEYHGISMNI